MAFVKGKFTEIANAQIKKGREAVISQLDDGSFTVGQRMELRDDEDRTIKIFLKGALHVADKQGLQNLRDAINLVLKNC